MMDGVSMNISSQSLCVPSYSATKANPIMFPWSFFGLLNRKETSFLVIAKFMYREKFSPVDKILLVHAPDKDQ